MNISMSTKHSCRLKVTVIMLGNLNHKYQERLAIGVRDCLLALKLAVETSEVEESD